MDTPAPAVDETPPAVISEHADKMHVAVAEILNKSGQQNNNEASEEMSEDQASTTEEPTHTPEGASIRGTQDQFAVDLSDGTPGSAGEKSPAYVSLVTRRQSTGNILLDTAEEESLLKQGAVRVVEIIQRLFSNDGSQERTDGDSLQISAAEGLIKTTQGKVVNSGSQGTSGIESTETITEALAEATQGGANNNELAGTAEETAKTAGEESLRSTTPEGLPQTKQEDQITSNESSGQTGKELLKTTTFDGLVEPPLRQTTNNVSPRKADALPETIVKGLAEPSHGQTQEQTASHGSQGKTKKSRETVAEPIKRQAQEQTTSEGFPGRTEESSKAAGGGLAEPAQGHSRIQRVNACQAGAGHVDEPGEEKAEDVKRDVGDIQAVPGFDQRHAQRVDGAAFRADGTRLSSSCYPGGPKISETIVSRLYQWHSTTPDRPALVFIKNGSVDASGRKNKSRFAMLTCSDLYDTAVRFAHVLKLTYDISVGDVVCNTLPNCPERAVIDLGTILAGALLLNAPRHVDTNQELDRFCDYLIRLDVRLVVYARTDPFSRLVVRRAQEAPNASMCAVHIDGDSPAVPGLLYALTQPGTPSLQQAEAALPLHIRAQDVCVLWPTTGRQGYPRNPKLVAHSHASVLRMSSSFNKYLVKANKSDVCYSSGNLGDMYGFPGLYLNFGITTLVECRSYCEPADWETDFLVLRARDQRPPLAWDTLIGYGCTRALFTTRDLGRYQDMRAFSKKFCQRRLKSLAVVGDVVKAALVRNLLSTVTRQVTVGYCMAEVGLVAFNQRPQNTDLLRIIKHLAKQVHVRSVRDNKLLPADGGGTGTLEIVTKHALAGLQSTGRQGGEVVLEKNVVLTDDLVAMHDDRLRVVGRVDRRWLRPDKPDFIREECEYVLRQVKGVADAALVVVFDKTPANVEPVLVACLVAEDDCPDPKDPYYYVKNRCVTLMNRLPGWRPAEYRFFDAFPKTPAGWLHRKALALEVERARDLQLGYDFHAHMQQEKEEKTCNIL